MRSALMLLGSIFVSATVQVSQICIQNDGYGLNLQWFAQASTTNNSTAMSGRYGVSETRCMNISDIPGIEDGQVVGAFVEVLLARVVQLDPPVIFNSYSESWATYTCRGVTFDWSCQFVESRPTSSNIALPWGPSPCFVEPTFALSDVTVQTDLTYGHAINPYHNAVNKNETLLMDAYLPPKSDQRARRPGVVLIHGGAYIKGDKGTGGIVAMAKALATRGYVAVSINYRLVPVSDLAAMWSMMPIRVGAEDSRAAVRFLRMKSIEWRIDTNRLAVIGCSAGAITTLFHGYAKGESEGESGNFGFSSAINTVISVSGAMLDRAFCASVSQDPPYEPNHCTITSPPGPDRTSEMIGGDIPAVFVHGTADRIIPYAGGFEAGARANSTGIRNIFLTVPGGPHVPMDDVMNETGPYLSQWTYFLSGALNTANAECPEKVQTIV